MNRQCENYADSKLAKECEGYYFCCYVKNAMVDKEDCRKCPSFQFKD